MAYFRTKYFADGDAIHYGEPGDSRHAANCQDAAKACALLNDAQWLNDAKRKYTAAARKISSAECLPGFEWIED